ncbi:MAG: efflux RND transporter permease subunit, partial [Bacteroidales bacterium]|nr:efflux RND transporter permease subunit [Bacteroidales bacterium]
YPDKGANHLVLAENVKNIMLEQTGLLPEKYSVLLNQDSTVFIQKELEIIGWRSLMTILILLVFVFLISLNLRYMIILTLSLFTNVALSFMFYYVLGINIHLYSLAGITISLGLIIDNSIVMIDHIRSYSNKKVYLALLASTLTTIASLSIVLFLPEKLQLNLRDFAFIIMINLAVSLVISLWYIPALLQLYPIKKRAKALLIKRRKRIIKANRFYFILSRVFIRWRMAFIIAGVLLFGLPVFWLPEKVEGERWYHQVYNQSIGSDWYQNDAKKWTEKALGGTLRLFVQNVYEGNYYREKQETKLYINAGLPEGATLEQLNDILVRMEQFLASFDEVRQFTTGIYSPQSGNITIFFKPEFEKTSFPYFLKGKLTQKAIDFSGINWNIYGVGQGYYNRTGTSESMNYSLQLSGYNYDELERQAIKLKGKLSQHPRVAEINTNARVSWYEKDYLYRYSLNADPYLLAAYDKPYGELVNDLNKLGINYRPMMYQLINERYEGIVIQSEESKVFDQWSIFNQPLDFDRNYNLSHLATIRKERMSPAIHKSNQQYIRKVDYKYNGNYKFGNRFRDKVLEEMNHEMPLGYSAETKEWNYWERNKTKPYHLILIVVLAVFMISAVLFESLRQPFAIVMLIPLSFVGVFLTFYGFDLNFDQGGYASFILLSGLVVNSAIYIINDFNNKMREVKQNHIRMNPLRIYIKAFNGKIIPVFLTVISSILGLVPFMTLGKEEPFWYAFAAGAIGGLVFSGLIMMVYLPLFLIKRV